MSMDSNSDFKLEDLFPDLNFVDEGDQEELTVESTIANINTSLLSAMPPGGATC